MEYVDLENQVQNIKKVTEVEIEAKGLGIVQ